MKEFVNVLITPFLLCSWIIIVIHLFILLWILQEENKMIEKENEQLKQAERKLQVGKTNLLRDVERLEKENEQLKQQIERVYMNYGS